MHVSDMADACIFLIEHYDDPAPINVGVGEDVTILEIAHTIARVVGFSGKLEFDASKPDGTPRKLLDVSRLRGLGWAPKIALEDGLRQTYAWFVEQSEQHAIRT